METSYLKVPIEGQVIYTIYTRVSTKKEEQKISKKYQEKELKAIGESRNDWLYCGESYTDDGITGTSIEKRLGFQKLLRDAEAGKFNLIIAREISRFARNKLDFLTSINKLNEAGVVVYFVDIGKFSTDSEADLMMYMYAYIAERQSKEKSVYTRKSHKVRREQGFVFGANDKYGYDLIKTAKGQSNILRKNKQEAKIVEEIFQMCIDGKGIRSIVKELNSRGLYTKKGKHWDTGIVDGILHNKVYCGYTRYNTSYKESILSSSKKVRDRSQYKYVKSDYVEQIISESDFESAQNRLKANSTLKVERVYDQYGAVVYDEDGQEKMKYKLVGIKPIVDIFSSKLQCECNCNFKHHRIRKPDKNGNRPIGYTCYNYDKGTILADGSKCRMKTVDRVKLDMQSLKIFHNIWSNNDIKESLEYAYEVLCDVYQEEIESAPTEDLSYYVHKCDSLKKYKEKLLRQLKKDTISEDEFESESRATNAEIITLEKNIERIRIENAKKESFSKDNVLSKLRCELNLEIVEEENEFGYKQISQDIIDNFVSKIVVHYDGSFDWYMNLTGGQQSKYQRNKFASNYHDRYMIKDNIREIFEFTIDLNEANEFVTSYGRGKFQNKRKDGEPIWIDIKTRVYIEL